MIKEAVSEFRVCSYAVAACSHRFCLHYVCCAQNIWPDEIIQLGDPALKEYDFCLRQTWIQKEYT